MIHLRIPRGESRPKAKTIALDFGIADFNLFRDLLGRIPWDIARERRRSWESWLILKMYPRA